MSFFSVSAVCFHQMTCCTRFVLCFFHYISFSWHFVPAHTRLSVLTSQLFIIKGRAVNGFRCRHVLRNNQQTLCTLTTFECCYQIKYKGREQNYLRTGDVTVFFRRQPLDPLRRMSSKKLKSCDKRSFNSSVHHLRTGRAWKAGC